MTRKTNHIGNKRQFVYHNPEASQVLLAGGFTGWEQHAIPMKRAPSGEWRATVTLSPGRHEYRFIVDGQWVEDQQCEERALNPYGTTNSVCTVAG